MVAEAVSHNDPLTVTRQTQTATQPDPTSSAVASRHTATTADASYPSPAQLLGPAVTLTPPGFPRPAPTAAGPSPWWPKPDKERVIEINGHAFDLEPARVNGEAVTGAVDGPLDYNGAYTIKNNHARTASAPAQLTMVLSVRGDSLIEVDLRVTISIRETATGARARVAFENNLAPPDDRNRVQIHDVPMDVRDDTCRIELKLRSIDDPAKPLAVTMEWSTR